MVASRLILLKGGHRVAWLWLWLLLAGALLMLLVEDASLSQAKWSLMQQSTDFGYKLGENRPEEQSSKVPQNNDHCDVVRQELESSTTRYYVYDNPSMTVPDIQATALNPHRRPTWRARWGKRFKQYSQGEVRFHQALQNHPLRTYNASEAVVFVVPIPICAMVFWGTPHQLENAWEALFQEPLFQQLPHKHVVATNLEIAFTPNQNLQRWLEGLGMTKKVYKRLAPVTLMKDIDLPYFDYFRKNQGRHSDWGPPSDETSLTVLKHSWSVGYSHEASHPAYARQNARFETWLQKPIHFFYHTTTKTSLNNSTQYRYAPVEDPHFKDRLPQPSSIGYNIPAKQWRHEFSNSKFCITIRGDNPSSRSLFRGIRMGCLPVIVSSAMPYYAPLFRSFLRFDDFAIMVEETDFLKDPFQAINRTVLTLSEAELRQKIKGLALLQQIIVLDHEEPLFVQAFLRETLASMQVDYYDFDRWSSFDPKR